MNQTPEILFAEFGNNDHDPIPCCGCPELADVRTDDGQGYCLPCVHEAAILRGLEPFRARYIGTVELLSLEFTEVEVQGYAHTDHSVLDVADDYFHPLESRSRSRSA